jgi:hypothetical protein
VRWRGPHAPRRARREGARVDVKSSWPFWTIAPSVKWIAVTAPETRGRTSTAARLEPADIIVPFVDIAEQRHRDGGALAGAVWFSVATNAAAPSNGTTTARFLRQGNPERCLPVGALPETCMSISASLAPVCGADDG